MADRAGEPGGKLTHRVLLIAWWSFTGATEQLAAAAAAAARLEASSARIGADDASRVDAGTAVDVRLRRCEDIGTAEVLDAAGFLFATPENLGSMAGAMKAFFDRHYYPALDQIAGRPYASLIAAGSDGQGAARQIERITTGWRLKRVAEPVIVITHAQTPEEILAPKRVPEDQLARARELGAALAAGLTMGLW